MNEWVEESNFAASGALLAPSERLLLSSSSGSSSAASPTPLTPTPTPQLTPAAPQEPPGTPSFEAFLAAPPAFAFQSARSRSEAALLFEVAGVALEMDVMLESVREQLHDRRRVVEWLRAAELGKAGTGAMDTALLVLQQQARGVTEHNLRLLLERFQTRLQTLADLQFPLIQSIESCEASASELEALGDAETAAQRRKFVEVQTALLERLRTLLRDDTVPIASRLVTSAQLRQQQPGRSAVCWPAASTNSEEAASRRSTMDDVHLSSSSSGSMHSPFSTLLALDERRLMDAEDLNVTLTDHHDAGEGNDRERVTQCEDAAVAGVQSSDAAATPLSQAEPRQSNDDASKQESSADLAASDHALSDSVY